MCGKYSSLFGDSVASRDDLECGPARWVVPLMQPVEDVESLVGVDTVESSDVLGIDEYVGEFILDLLDDSDEIDDAAQTIHVSRISK